MPYYIYTLTDPRNLITRYVGISIDPVNRYSQHISEAGGGSIAKESWLRGLLRLQITPAITIIDEAKTQDEARRFETFWIDYYRRRGAPLLNAQQLHASPQLVTQCYDHMNITPEEAENALAEIARCVAQGRFQDIPIKQIAQIEYLISSIAEGHSISMAIHGEEPYRSTWRAERQRRVARLGVLEDTQ